jgi:hypothetical protein
MEHDGQRRRASQHQRRQLTMVIQKGTHPANPTQVKNCLNDFYSKDYTGNVILNTTIELTSTTDFWTARKKVVDIIDYTKRNNISIHLISRDMLQEIAVEMIT